MKRLMTTVLAFLLTWSALSSVAQDRLLIDGEEAKALISRITEAHDGIKSISSDFTQKKNSALLAEEIVQKGCFKYAAPETLIWEYTWPVEMKFDLSARNDKMSMMLKQMILDTITGATLTDVKNFSATYYRNDDNTISVVLVPIAKRLQKMYKELCIVINSGSLYAESLSFIEANNDKTIISFNNQEVTK